LPGPTTNAFTGADTGVINAAELANTTAMANAWGDCPSSAASEIATGAINTAVALFDINNPNSAVMPYTAASIMKGLALPTILVSACTAKSTPPVFCNAVENGSMPTIRKTVGQWMERYAASASTHRNRPSKKQPISAASTFGTTP